MKYEAVLWDMDGTVVDSLQDIADAVNYTLRHFGLPETAAEALRPKLGWGARTLLRLTLPEDTSEARLDEILDFYKAYYAVHARDHSRPFDGILPMLHRLRDAGLKLAIISNKPDSAVQPLAEKYFAQVMTLCVGERPEIPRKPAPDMLVAAAQTMNVSLDRCLYVGDSEVDIETARNTGIDCACVTWGFRSKDELIQAGAQNIFDTPDALYAFAARP